MGGTGLLESVGEVIGEILIQTEQDTIQQRCLRLGQDLVDDCVAPQTERI